MVHKTTADSLMCANDVADLPKAVEEYAHRLAPPFS